MNDIRRQRPDKVEHYLNRAKVAAERSTCLRRKVGAVIIKNDAEVSSGYVGSPRNTENCIDLGTCIRIEMGTPSGERYELCRSVHAEQNAIINAARTGANVMDGEMYISSEIIGSGYSESTKKMSQTNRPCALCMKEIINAGLTKVYMRDELSGEVKSYSMPQLKRILESEFKRLGKRPKSK
ncbi:MAG: dCMP deaminase family protein [Chloroflexota bacterium]|nr:dCMP deaminase family protein [Chloroflexota bacterium]